MGKFPNKSDIQALDTDTADIKPDKVKNARKIMGAVSKFAQNPKKKKPAKQPVKQDKLDSDGDID